MALGSSLVEQVRQSAELRRMLAMEQLAEVESAKLKNGVYKAYWQEYSNDGRGRVLYAGKIYTATVLATTSIQRNGIVSLTITNNEYFVNW